MHLPVLAALLLVAPAVHAPAPVFAVPAQSATTPATAPAADTLILVAADEGNVARYRVREQLARLDFPNDAVGETRNVSGSLMVTSDGQVLREGSRFVIRLAELESDQDRRDNFLRRNTLNTEEYPDAVFVPTGTRGLDFPLAEGAVRFELLGEMTIRDVTRPVTWEVDAEVLAGGAMLGRAETRFTFGEMGLTIPSVGSVLSIRDDIRLEYDFRLVPAGSQP